jgi:mannonate dehydratase
MRITGVRAILTAPEGIALVVVRVDTDQPGLYGLGCATFTQRPTLVSRAVDEYLAPLLVGRDPANVEDLWHLMSVNSYWRTGPVLNNAISGVDMALWDIKGKVAGMPVYDLWGGRSRPAAMVYRHADGREPAEVLDAVLAYREAGVLAVRCQMGGYGGRTRIGRQILTLEVDLEAFAGEAFPGAYYDPDRYARQTVELFEHVRGAIGPDLHLLHDIHERLVPIEAVRLAKALEPYRLFFLEDALPPDQLDWFRRIREACTTPIAMGELWVNPVEWRTLISERLIDFVRAHVSAIGGVTPARKLGALAEAFGVRTAWHGPGDVSPIGHAANLHLALVSHNFGIQEVPAFSDSLREVFPGTPELRGGYLHANDGPGWGVDIDEEAAARYPIRTPVVEWTQARWPDGTVWTP